MIKIERTTIRKSVYLNLRNRIIEGLLGPGTKLNYRQLSLELDVSTMPIREAIQRLANEGLVEIIPGKSTHVSESNPHKLQQYLQIAHALENDILKDIISKVTNMHINNMIDINHQLLRALEDNRRLQYLKLQQDFYNIYLNLSVNKALLQIISTNRLMILRLNFHYFDQISGMESIYHDHIRIIEAFKNHSLCELKKAVKELHKNSIIRLKSLESFYYRKDY
jgi:DNA-binding GntR family transcriptional regulator